MHQMDDGLDAALGFQAKAPCFPGVVSLLQAGFFSHNYSYGIAKHRLRQGHAPARSWTRAAPLLKEKGLGRCSLSSALHSGAWCLLLPRLRPPLRPRQHTLLSSRAAEALMVPPPSGVGAWCTWARVVVGAEATKRRGPRCKRCVPRAHVCECVIECIQHVLLLSLSLPPSRKQWR